MYWREAWLRVGTSIPLYNLGCPWGAPLSYTILMWATTRPKPAF